VALPEEVMKICLKNISKRYHRHWIFKKVSYVFEDTGSYAILGANGSGKSTLLRIIGGMQAFNAGELTYTSENAAALPPENIFERISYCAPGMDLIEELSLTEFLKFHFSFKKIIPGYSIDRVIEEMQLAGAAHKLLRDFSSGMKQRAKLAQAFFSDTPLLLLDEPCSNLDQQGVDLYQQCLHDHTKGRMTIIASNDLREYQNARIALTMDNFKENI